MRNESAAESEMLFTTKQLAEILNLSPRRVQQLAEEGVLVKSSRGKYKAVESIQNFIRQLSKEQSSKASGVDYFDERALHEKAKREKAQLELAVMKGELHRSEDVEFVMNDMIAAFRSRILAIPSKLAPQLAGKTDIPMIQQLLSLETNEALTELSNYDPAAFYENNPDYVGPVDSEEAE